MRELVKFFIKYPIWSNAIIFTLLVFGVSSYVLKLNKSAFPEVERGIITVNVVMPGAAPEEMEEGVTIKVEEAVKSLEGIKEVTSSSSENTANITIELFKDYDVDEVLDEVKSAVNQINSFPVSAEKPIIAKRRSRSLAVRMALRGDMPLKELKEIAQQVEDDFLATGFISQVNLEGFPALEISIEVPEANLLRYGLRFDDVANAVRNNNRDISGGVIKSKTEEIIIRSRAKNKEAEAIGNIVLKATADGKKLYLKDVASIKEQFADTPFSLKVNGETGVSITVNKLPEEDLEQISNFIDDYVAKFNAENANASLSVGFSFMTLLRERLEMLVENGLIGLTLVLITLGLFLSLRLSFWVAWGIPASFLGMLIIGAWVGITINLVTLFGMILVVGILVDDGIVIAENIYSHFEQGKSAKQAAVDGTMEVLPSVFTSVTTTIVAFVPLMMLEGLEYWFELSVVVIAALGMSLIEAFFVLPAHLASPKILEHKDEESLVRQKLNQAIDWLRFNLYGTALAHILRFRVLYAAAPLAFIFLVLGLMQGGFIKTTFFPYVPFDQFEINLAFKAGTPEDRVEEYLDRFEKKVWEVNEELKAEFADSVDYVSYTFTNTGRTSDGSETGGHAGHVAVLMQDMENRKHISTLEIANRVGQKIGKVPEAEIFKVGGSNRWGKPVSVQLMHKNSETLQKAKDELKAELQQFTELKNVDDSEKAGKRELNLELKPKAYFLGLSHGEIARQIRQGFFGEEVQRLQKGTDEVRVWVRYPEADRKTLGQLEKMKIKMADGREFPLEEVADYTLVRGIVDIKHLNGARQVAVEADLKDPNASAKDITDKIASDLMPSIQAKYAGLKVQYGGQSKRSAQSFASLKQVLPSAIFIMVLLLTLTFRSFSQAMLIFLLIPVGVFSAFTGHFFEAKPVSILSMLGVLALSGVIINDAVVLTSKFNSNLRQGMSLFDALHDAGVSRFRPILLTTITTVVGLFPLIKEESFQAQFLIPMAISMAYGVLIGTFFILTTYPAILMVVNDIRRFNGMLKRALGNFWKGDKVEWVLPSAEEVEPTMREFNAKKVEEKIQ